ncbi:TIGR02679 family protein [Aquibacillus salsiterrae]|uniref:TIGR02679 family protein n=1 Tax=Aquibacillus salsiterrae TaxID=2950439 RepID=A0A9X3WEQ7_9BACI|nr:TIGR02679 family protein [Aquibacillus salsiterrae]MDC3418472.1 TIGR02679 family protein [Aquibacillus salsiterrae]
MINEALTYFKGDAGYLHLFTLFKKKYESIGRIGGTVKLAGFSDDELASVASFFGLTPLELKEKGKVSLEQFDVQLQRTKFEGIGLHQLLEAYFNAPLISKKEAKQRKEQQMGTFLVKLENDVTALRFWFRYLRQKSADTYWIYRYIEEDPAGFEAAVHCLSKAFNHLPVTYERLPMLSQRITRNPHAFDLNTILGRLLVHLLSVHRAGDEKVVVPTDSEGTNDLLLTYRIMRDDITNYVTGANLIAETDRGVHSMWGEAAKSHSVMNIPLREIVTLKRVYPFSGQKVWIVENSGVYSSLLDELPHVPLLCTHGQFKLAALLLMDLLVQEGCELHYAGDLDPEGVGMAARLLERYPNHVHLWKMSVKDYEASVSEMVLSSERLSKLDSIGTNELSAVIATMKHNRKAAYQEALVTEMLDELKCQL